MKLNELFDNPGAKHRRMIVGRGIGSGKGKQCGRGGKGQKARTGVSIRGFEGGQMPIHRRLPKRGFNNFNFRYNFAEINLGSVQKAIDTGRINAAQTITYDVLRAANLIEKAPDGLRLLGKGVLKTKLNFEIAGASASAVAAVEKLGGSVKILLIKKEAAAA